MLAAGELAPHVLRRSRPQLICVIKKADSEEGLLQLLRAESVKIISHERGGGPKWCTYNDVHAIHANTKKNKGNVPAMTYSHAPAPAPL